VDDATAHASAHSDISAPPQHPSSLLALVSVTQSDAAAAVDAMAGRPAISVTAISEASSLFSKANIPAKGT
jgi:hypothetical protein